MLYEFLMAPVFDDSTGIHNIDAICRTHAGEAMRNQENRVAPVEIADVVKESRFRPGIKRCRGFIKNDERCVSVERSGKSDSLPLSYRKIGSTKEFWTEEIVVTLWQFFNELVRLGQSAGFPYGVKVTNSEMSPNPMFSLAVI